MGELFIGGKRPEDIIRKQLEDLAKQQPNLPPPTVKTPAPIPPIPPLPAGAGFYIQDLPDRYVLNNLMYTGELWTVGWGKNLLDNGQAHTQDQWVDLTKTAEFKLACGPLYLATIFALYDHKDIPDTSQNTLVNRMKKMFKDDFDPSKPWKMTSTRISYAPQTPVALVNPDRVEHNFGYSNQFGTFCDLVGPSECLKSGHERTIDGLLMTQDLPKLEAAAQWLTGKRTYLWRLSSRPQSETQRVLVLGCVDGDGFSIGANGSIGGNRPARGVVAVRAKNPT